MMLRTGLVLAVLVGFYSGVAAAVEVGEKAPEIRATEWMNSRGVSLASSRDKIVVVEFWATWCGPCMSTIPHLISLNNKYKDKGVVIVGMTNEEKSEVATTVARLGMNYAVATGSPTANDYGVSAIPTAFIVAPGGKVVWKGHPAGMDDALASVVRHYAPRAEASR